MNRRSIPRHLSLARSWKNDGAAEGFSVTLEVAFRCNVRCVFCSRWSDPTDLSLEVIERVAEDMAAMKARYVSLTGGDPFVRADIKQIIDAFATRGVPIHINTNGVLLRKQAEFLISRAAAIRSITVSIDSPHPEIHDEIRGVQGTFARALAGMDAIRRAIEVDLACTLNQKNLHEIEEYTQFAREHGYDFRFQPLHDDGANQLSPNQEGVTVEQDALQGLTRRLESVLQPRDPFGKTQYYRLFEPFFRNRDGMNGLRCVTAARLIYFIDPQGDVYPCDTRRDVKLGNVYERRFAEIARGPASTDWRSTCRKNENGCWCMYACVAPNNLRYQDLPLRPLTRGGWPFKRRWEKRVASFGYGAREPEALPPVQAPAEPAGGEWPAVAVVMASYNGGDFLLESLAGAFALDYPADRCEVILVDDASGDGSIEKAERRYAAEVAAGRLRVLRNAESKGVAGAYNTGVLAARDGTRYVMKMDNDLVPDPAALREMVRLAEANPRAGIVGGRIYYHADPRRIYYLGGDLASARRGPGLLRTPPDLLRDPEGAAPRWLDVISSCMSLVRREVFERAGLYPEFYGRYEYEDYDLAFRARRLGFGSLFCPGAAGYHAVSLTSRANDLGSLRLRLRARNGSIFMYRYTPKLSFLTYLAYQVAKLPFDFLRHGHSPWNRLSGFAEGVRFALGGDFPASYLPTRSGATPPPAGLSVVGGGRDRPAAASGCS
jgi:radical SAM protein with 4Fe4S-binding SPASM domain